MEESKFDQFFKEFETNYENLRRRLLEQQEENATKMSELEKIADKPKAYDVIKDIIPILSKMLNTVKESRSLELLKFEIEKSINRIFDKFNMYDVELIDDLEKSGNNFDSEKEWSVLTDDDQLQDKVAKVVRIGFNMPGERSVRPAFALYDCRSIDEEGSQKIFCKDENCDIATCENIDRNGNKGYKENINLTQFIVLQKKGGKEELCIPARLEVNLCAQLINKVSAEEPSKWTIKIEDKIYQSKYEHFAKDINCIVKKESGEYWLKIFDKETNLGIFDIQLKYLGKI